MFAECLEVMVDVLSAGRARKGCNIEAWLLAQCLHGNVSLTAQISPLRREHGLSEITVGLRQGGVVEGQTVAPPWWRWHWHPLTIRLPGTRVPMMNANPDAITCPHSTRR